MAKKKTTKWSNNTLKTTTNNILKTTPNTTSKFIKIISMFVLIIVIANFFLYLFGVYSELIFWVIIIIAAIFAFPILNSMKNK